MEYDTDVNLTNVLIGPDWKIWRIDFTRAFRLNKDPQHLDDLVRCERQLFDKLKTLDENELTVKTKGYLNKEEVKALMARRDKILLAGTEHLVVQDKMPTASPRVPEIVLGDRIVERIARDKQA